MFKGIPYSLMCTFIIISGYFYVRGRTFAENIKRRVLKLLIYCNLGPYGVFSFSHSPSFLLQEA